MGFTKEAVGRAATAEGIILPISRFIYMIYIRLEAKFLHSLVLEDLCSLI